MFRCEKEAVVVGKKEFFVGMGLFWDMLFYWNGCIFFCYRGYLNRKELDNGDFRVV